MVTQFVPGQDDNAAIMACIGNVCIQWALLEQNIMGILGACPNCPLEEVAILFGGLDMKPRLNMAIKIALGFAVWMIGLDSFKPLVRGFILGRADEEFGYWIEGNEPEGGEPPSQNALVFQLQRPS